MTAFSQADGYVVIPAQTERLAAGTPVQVHLIAERLEPADLVTIGSHCVGLDYLLGRLQAEGYSTKSLHVGSQGGLAAARRGECDLGGIHLMHPDTGVYNQDYLTDELQLVTGYRRMQGVVFRPDDPRFSDRETARDAVAAALADPDCVMVNRNAGSGTRILIDGLLGEARPDRLCRSDQVPQCGGQRRRPGPGGLGSGHRHRRAAVRARLPAVAGGALRLRGAALASATPRVASAAGDAR